MTSATVAYLENQKSLSIKDHMMIAILQDPQQILKLRLVDAVISYVL